MKYLFPILIIALLIGYATYRAVAAANTVGRLSIDLDVKSTKLGSVDTNGARITTAAIVQNPDKGRVTIGQPYIRILYNGSEIAHSTASTNQITIEPQSQTSIPIDLTIPFATLLPIVGTSLFTGGGVLPKVSVQLEIMYLGSVLKTTPVEFDLQALRG